MPPFDEIKDDTNIPNDETFVRFVNNCHVYYNDNIEGLAIVDDRPIWSFLNPQTGNNEGMSGDALKRILSDSKCPTDIYESLKCYYTACRNERFFLGKSYYGVSVDIIRQANLKITATPSLNRPHHLDVWPSEGSVDFLEGQRENLSVAFKWVCVTKSND
jgi:hypothetical protein